MYKVAVIIPSAGSGKRFKSELPKPYVLLKGRPILQRTVDLFTSIPSVKQIIIPTSKALQERSRELFRDYSLPVNVIEGGSTRQYSIQNAISHIDENIDLIAVHDAVRPFVTKKTVENCCEEALNVGGAVVGIKVKDTIKKVDQNRFVIETPDRNTLWQCQTPQIFRKNIFIEAYEHAYKNKFIGTDDASVVEFYGKPVKMIEGNSENIKITYPLDLLIAESLIQNEITGN
ncbi:MAG TPA: 2-C-methyl-D-erythritol 4-phosphate cytidylyltransferase [Balneolales bacterium]|nr:2-C-methyl-D-erythritol 4-phosphate cytidylyltransferase [Balneolales bacterium]